MKTYHNRISGEVLERRKLTYPANRYAIELHSLTSSEVVGSIYFGVNRARSELDVRSLDVNGHTNAPTATGNPHPGCGRLLLYIACRSAMKQGCLRVRLQALSSNIGFYRPMGFRPTGAPQPPVGGAAFHAGTLNRQWKYQFSRAFAEARGSDDLVSSISTVLLNIASPTHAQWEERNNQVCIVM